MSSEVSTRGYFEGIVESDWSLFVWSQDLSILPWQTHCVDQANLELTDLPASASQVLGLKVWASVSSLTDLL